nr:uncharacterized protein LOC109154292 [Ipomoea trifida]
MEFNWKGKNIALTGIKSLNSRQASFTQLQAMMHKGQVAELYELLQMSNHLAPAANDESISFPVDLSPEIHQIIQNHEQLFQTPTGLPPRRPLSHHISLIPGVKPVNVAQNAGYGAAEKLRSVERRLQMRREPNRRVWVGRRAVEIRNRKIISWKWIVDSFLGSNPLLARTRACWLWMADPT